MHLPTEVGVFFLICRYNRIKQYNIRRLGDKMKQQWQEGLDIKIKHFGKEVIFSYPNQTMAVSVTGNQCSLKCAHCNGHYLKGMTQVDGIGRALQERKITSFLLSGGCDQEGQVRLADNLESIKNLKKQGYKINSHLGLIEEKYLNELIPFLDVVSFDLILDKATIQEVYKLDRSPEDYKRTYEMLSKKIKVVPHILLGLYKGKIKGEYEVLEYLREHMPPAITFIVLIPTKGTEYEGLEPPNLEAVGDFLLKARKLFPNIPLKLGCMRPKGAYRTNLDKLALDIGINQIVMPSKATYDYAKEQGFNITEKRECCVL
jgi:uncharacterized radical SAM superfamily protein